MSSEPTGSPKLRVLIADDDPVVGILATETLRQAGFDTLVVSDGSASLASFDRYVPDIILLDVGMPGANGFDLCAAIRRRPGGEHLPIVMVTGRDLSSRSRKAW
jgi:DNA-binding response OmpR family regulator